jgi:hypothetical protein
MSTIDELFAPMRDAPIFGRGNYMGAGIYKVRLKKAFDKKSFKGPRLFIAEFEIVESSNEAHKPGTTGSWATKLEGDGAANAFGDIKCLMFALLGRNGRDVPASEGDAHTLVTAMARAVCGSDSAKAELKAQGVQDVEALVSGTEVALECAQVKTKAGHDFTRYTWSPSVSP